MTEKKAAAKPTRLAPIVTPDAKFFWDAADREEFVGQRCGDCQRFRFPPRPMCPHCHSLKTEIVKLSGRGKVCSWIQPRHPMPFGFAEPPIVATIDLEEGIRFVSNLYDVVYDKVSYGMPVEVFFADTMPSHKADPMPGHKVPVFRPSAKAGAKT
jgi:uncharacterized OB-fold protein